MTNAYASGDRSMTNRPSSNPARCHSSPNAAAGTRNIAGANKTAARCRGVRAFSGKTQAKTTIANCINRAITKLAATHQPEARSTG